MKKQYVIKIIVCALLSIVLILGNCINSFANEITPTPTPEHGGGGHSRKLGYGIYSNTELNQQTINAWNDLTLQEKKNLIPSLYPIILKKLGALVGNPSLDYNTVAEYWEIELNAYKAQYSSDIERFRNENSWEITDLFCTSEGWYNYYYEFLADHIVLDNGLLVTDSQTNENIYTITNNYVNDQIGEMGFVQKTISSYKNISPSQFDNANTYENLIALCEQHKNNKFVVLYTPNYSGKVTELYAIFPINGYDYIYLNGDNGQEIVGTFKFVNKYGITGLTSDTTEVYYKPNSSSNFGKGSLYRNTIGGSIYNTRNNIQRGNGHGYNGNIWTGNFSIYTLNEVATIYNLQTSIDGFINNAVDWDNPFNFDSFWGSVPSTTTSSADMTYYYNQNYISDSHNNSTYNIYYPDTYNPYDNKYDSENKTLDFSGIGNLLSSIGAFLGSIINGIAQGIANIINSLTSIFQNISGLMNGSVSGFLGAIFGFLPSEFVTVLLAGISLSILFMILSFIRR